MLASYVFYAWWDWRFLGLILLSTVLDFGVGILIEKAKNSARRKLLLSLSLTVNLGLLGFLKYYNFFIDNFVEAFQLLGHKMEGSSLQVILPVGISFYTFQTLSYSLDVYHRKIRACQDFIAFSAFVCFFPQLVAGPIERASHLLPQFESKRSFHVLEAQDGMRQILWGLFKKIVIADNCAIFANQLFNHSDEYQGFALFAGALFFTFQIYGDFSGYSDIAIGTARLFRFDLKQNFAYPYFSRNMAEFWRRWHISLSSWFRDYVYIPLGGSRGSRTIQLRNILIIFLLSGFWHGANWTFIFWGALHALFFLPLLLLGQNRVYLQIVAQGKMLPSLHELGSMLITFLLAVLTWIFFRADTLVHAWSYLTSMIVGLAAKQGYVQTLNLFYWEVGYELPLLILFMLLLEWWGREGMHALEHLKSGYSTAFRWLIYFGIGFVIFSNGNFQETEFIYFDF